MKYEYIKILSPEERVTALLAGACKAASRHPGGQHILRSMRHADGEKLAIVQTKANIIRDAFYAAMAASVLAGVPIGLAAHATGKGSKHRSKKEKQLLGSIDQYASAAHRLNPRGGEDV